MRNQSDRMHRSEEIQVNSCNCIRKWCRPAHNCTDRNQDRQLQSMSMNFMQMHPFRLEHPLKEVQEDNNIDIIQVNVVFADKICNSLF